MHEANGVSFYFCSGSTFIVTPHAVTCGLCGQAHYLFTNRDGVTLCLLCAKPAPMKEESLVRSATCS